MMLIKKAGFSIGLLSLIALISTMPFSTVHADEGMFMMDKVASLPLAKMGLKIKPHGDL